MKTRNLLLLLGVAALAVVVYFLWPEPDTKMELSDDQKNGKLLMQTAQQLCLSGESATAGLNLESIYESGFKLQAGGEREKVRGAVNYLDEKIRNIQDEQIRACLEGYKEQIKACMLGDCSQANVPRSVDFQFYYEALPGSQFISEDEVYFGIKYRENKRKLTKQPPPNDFYVDSIEFPDKGEEIQAVISPASLDSHLGQGNEIRFVLKRAEHLPARGERFTRYRCSAGQGCKLDETAPVLLEWLPLASTQGGIAVQLFPSAYAQPATSEHWAIPSLEYLRTSEAAREIGYTEFSISADQPVDADAYYIDISVNGQRADENGVEGAFRARDLQPGTPFSFEFGLQNLSFSGGDSGCDTISVEINFLKNGEPHGDPVTLQRSYVALRDAAPVDREAGGMNWRWSGKYVRAESRYDNEVFIGSIAVADNLDFEAHRREMMEAVEKMNKAKRTFDAANLSFEGHPVIAVIRPPLTKISYGLAAGLVENNGQVRFTFERSVASRLADFLLEARASTPSIRPVVHHKKYIYTIRGSADFMQSPPICPGEGII